MADGDNTRNKYTIYSVPRYLVRWGATQGEGLTGRIMTCKVSRPDGASAVYVPFFTDHDLAERYIAAGGDAARGFRPVLPTTVADFGDLLELIAAAGITHIAIDPTVRGVRLSRIDQALEDHRNRDKSHDGKPHGG